MKKKQKDRRVIGCCAYCGNNATDIEHVIARQFYSSESIRKKHIPRVVACRSCNLAKQHSEDIVGVFLPLMDSSADSKEIDGRISRTLVKNHKISRMLTESIQEIVSVDFLDLEHPENNITTRFKTVSPTLEVIQEIRDFFKYLLRGISNFENRGRITEDFEIGIEILRDRIEHDAWVSYLSSLNLGIKLSTYGDFRFVYLTQPDDTNIWLMSFRDLYVAAIIANPAVDSLGKALIDEFNRKHWENVPRRRLPPLRVIPQAL